MQESLTVLIIYLNTYSETGPLLNYSFSLLVKFALEHTMKAQSGSRDTVLLFL